MSLGDDAVATVFTFSVSCSTGKPYAPCNRRPTAHHADTPTERTTNATRRGHDRARRSRPAPRFEDQPQERCDDTSSNDDALTPPTARHDECDDRRESPPSSCTARIVQTTSHGNAATAGADRDARGERGCTA